MSFMTESAICFTKLTKEITMKAEKKKTITDYEKTQTDAIVAWKKEEPGVVSQTFGIALQPLGWLVNKIVPQAAIRGSLDCSNWMARWMTDTNDIVRDGGVSKVEDLRTKSLELSDKLADEVHNWAIGIAVVEGAGTGFFGLPGAVADVPAIITLALRTIHKIGVCYGYEATTELDSKFVLGIMAASGANDMKEKVAALVVLREMQGTLVKKSWQKMAEKASEFLLSKEAAILAIRNLAKQLGINITKRKALASIPFIGAAIGGSVNGWYIKEVGWAARRAFQERWLLDNKKIIEAEIVK
jgi:hypothetical protein